MLTRSLQILAVLSSLLALGCGKTSEETPAGAEPAAQPAAQSFQSQVSNATSDWARAYGSPQTSTGSVRYAK